MAEDKKDFFISYNGKDKNWAEWIAWQLEATGYTVIIQAWDFRPGDRFGLKMQEATTKADRTLAVLSPNYLAALYTQPEWEAAFIQDPTGAKGTLLPVRVAECELQGLLQAIVYIDLVGREEADAKKELLAGIGRGRAKPSVSPPFPSGQVQISRPPPRFPEAPLLVRKIKQRIRMLLNQPRTRPLRDELIQQAGEELVEEKLVMQQPESPIQALDLIHSATKSCLEKLAEQKSALMNPAKEIAREIFGWLVLLAVNNDQVNCSSCKFDPWQSGIKVRIPLESEAGTEVLVSFLGGRAAWFKLKYDNENRPLVVGQDSLTIGGLEMGIGYTDPLTEVLKCIWVEVMKSKAPIPFGSDELKQLKATLTGRERRKESHYYITVPSKHTTSVLADNALLIRLLKALPSLRVMYIGREQEEGILLMDEYELWESIQAFLLMLRDLP